MDSEIASDIACLNCKVLIFDPHVWLSIVLITVALVICLFLPIIGFDDKRAPRS